MKKTSLSHFAEQAKIFKHVIFQKEIECNFSSQSVLALFESIKTANPDAVLLENAESGILKKSIICFKKMKHIQSPHDSFHDLRAFLQEFSCAPLQIKEFVGHVIGFMSYDVVRTFEAIPNRHPTSMFPEFTFSIYQIALCFHYETNKLSTQYIAETNASSLPEYQQAEKEVAKLLNYIAEFSSNQSSAIDFLENTPEDTNETTNIDDTQFKSMVEKAKTYIRSGDIFQVVLSRTFEKKYSKDPFNIYKVLRKKYPTPYLFYLPFEDVRIIGASPETFVKVQNNLVSVNPIAGTRKRTQTPKELEASLLNDKKEVAEHMMLVDLARNDVGRIAQPGSVNVAELLKVKHFSHVSHITSTVTGQLAPNFDYIDALIAAFPAGTLSGAPKIRAMEIIDELEDSRRNLYGGAICCLDFNGNLDSCIAIRTTVIKNNTAFVRTGAGIVADSDSQTEADETRHKAQAMLQAITIAEEYPL